MPKDKRGKSGQERRKKGKGTDLPTPLEIEARFITAHFGLGCADKDIPVMFYKIREKKKYEAEFIKVGKARRKREAALKKRKLSDKQVIQHGIADLKRGRARYFDMNNHEYQLAEQKNGQIYAPQFVANHLPSNRDQAHAHTWERNLGWLAGIVSCGRRVKIMSRLTASNIWRTNKTTKKPIPGKFSAFSREIAAVHKAGWKAEIDEVEEVISMSAPQVPKVNVTPNSHDGIDPDVKETEAAISYMLGVLFQHFSYGNRLRNGLAEIGKLIILNKFYDWEMDRKLNFISANESCFYKYPLPRLFKLKVSEEVFEKAEVEEVKLGTTS